MATATSCDGCGTTPLETWITVGRLATVEYCPACFQLWQAYAARQAAELDRLVNGFEAWRAANRGTVSLKVWPDA